MKDPRELLQEMINDQLPAWERVEAGRHLAVLGDPREEVLLPEKMQFIEIEPDSFVMGEGDEEYTHTLDYPYAIARYPVTNAQYRAFVEAGGYGKERYWVEAAAAGFWKDGAIKGRFDDSPRKEAKDYGTPFNLSNHPVVGVTWYEALAFCRWLTDFFQDQGLLPSDRQASLPSEPEWERAARGRDGWSYPWGGNPDPDMANCFETGIGTTSAVGCFAAGASPDGVEEMSGNVWEWTRSLQRPLRVVRGGSFLSNDLGARGARRLRDLPDNLNVNRGFRVVFSLSPLKPEPLNPDHLEGK